MDRANIRDDAELSEMAQRVLRADLAGGPPDDPIGVAEGEEPGPARMILKRISDRWSLLVLDRLRDGPLRFHTIAESLPAVSPRMLVATLRSLERDGFVTRTVYPEVPPHVEYEATELAQSLTPEIVPIFRWAWEHYEQIVDNRRRYDAEHSRE